MYFTVQNNTTNVNIPIHIDQLEQTNQDTNQLTWPDWVKPLYDIHETQWLTITQQANHYIPDITNKDIQDWKDMLTKLNIVLVPKQN
jgi:hypothetical protein